jgi:hypothetical protein
VLLDEHGGDQAQYGVASAPGVAASNMTKPARVSSLLIAPVVRPVADSGVGRDVASGPPRPTPARVRPR